MLAASFIPSCAAVDGKEAVLRVLDSSGEGLARALVRSDRSGVAGVASVGAPSGQTAAPVERS